MLGFARHRPSPHRRIAAPRCPTRPSTASTAAARTRNGRRSAGPAAWRFGTVRRASSRPARSRPTRRRSSRIGAVIGTILGAVLLGLFVSSLNPIRSDRRPLVAVRGADPHRDPGALGFGRADRESPAHRRPARRRRCPGRSPSARSSTANRIVVEPVEVFTPGQAFAYSPPGAPSRSARRRSRTRS